ncbi:terminase large subunit, partial [Terribacillus sp. 7520-G]|uniref:terminase large subunit n=1 Tax=Terribacillus sp. 7520-G TaxID=2025389 RepID=UPI000BCA00C9
MPHDFTTEYAQNVVDGNIVAGKKIIQACQRHLNDLKRAKSDDYEFHFVPEEASKIVNFIEILPDPDSGKELKLAPFQKWLLGSLYGWRFKDDNSRRFSRALISMARKQGKTVIVSAIGSYELLAGNYPERNRQILFTSNAIKQARIGYEMMQDQFRLISKKSKTIRKRIKVLDKEIKDQLSNSKARAMASDSSTMDGFAPTVAVIDEFHESRDTKMYDVLKSGMIRQKNGLLAIISTAGLNLNVPMYAEYKYLDKVLNGEVESERYFIAIYEQDSEEEIHKPELWEKSNPLLCIPEGRKTAIDNIQDDLKKGLDEDNINGVLVKNFNMWRQASEDSYMSGRDWDKCLVKEPVDIRGKSVYFGVDLSKNDDLTSV